MRYLTKNIQVAQVSKSCPFMLKMYGIDTQTIPLKKLWYIQPQIFKTHLLKYINQNQNSSKCPFITKQIKDICQESNESKQQKNLKNQKSQVKYEQLYENSISNLKTEGRYRVFTPVSRLANQFPQSLYKENQNQNTKEVTMWCSNDYMGMAQKPQVINALIQVAQETGVGSGGTRNIGGNSFYHLNLEKEIADLHQKTQALVCSSGFVANQAAIVGISKVFPDMVIFSDEQNHSSIIEGIKSSNREKYIFKHNNLYDLEQKLRKIDINRPKLIIFESVYSMSGSIAPIQEIINLAKTYNAQTLIDEVHAVGLYGKSGAGVVEKLNLSNQIDFITGTLGKAFGVFGGYIAANSIQIDCIRSHAPNFIFTTSIPPCIAAAAQASIQYLKQRNDLRVQLHERAQYIKDKLIQNNITIIDNPSHIIPILIGDATKAKMASDILLKEYQIYIQPINFPTVKKGEEILRISTTPNHNYEMIDHLVKSLKEVFERIDVKPQNKNCPFL